VARTALIFGIGGQDGALLARLLLDKGYEVHGTSRDHEASSFPALRKLQIIDRVTLHSAALSEYRGVVEVIATVRPDEIYNLAAQSSVGLSFNQPVNTINSTILGVINMLEALRFLHLPTRLYSASSGEMFGNTGPRGADENTAFNPRSPYAVGKAAAHWAVANYRESYGLFACSGILFNHESPLRPRRFVTRKVVAGAVAIKRGAAKDLRLGDLSIQRDWGWAEEYVQAMWLMLQQESPRDYVIATGEANSLERFAATAFAALDLDWRRYVVRDPRLNRPTDILFSCGRPERAAEVLGWQARSRMPDVVRGLIEAELSGAGLE
jgi:GDPmannose 4,6-dehydratase